MITKYKINGDTLILELNFDYEFGSFEKKDLKDLYDKIIAYTKDRKIKFKGDNILLIASGILIGTIYLSNNYISEINDHKKNNVTSNLVNLLDFNHKNVLDLKNSYFIPNDIIEINETDIKEKEDTLIKNEETSKEITKSSSTGKSTTNRSNSNNKGGSSSSSNSNSNNNSNTNSSNNSSSNNNNTPSVNKEVDKVTYITLYKSNGSVETLELEQYLIGVVAAEMPASFHIEALKAQAVVARSYTLKLIDEGRKLTNTSSTQNYITTSDMKNKWGSEYNKYYEKIKNAVETTKGVYVTYNNKPIDAVYHSTNNGYTESAVSVWGNSIPYLQSVSSVHDKSSTQYLREITLNFSELNTILGTNFSIDTLITSTRNTTTNYVNKIIIDDISYNGVNFRNLLGLRSTDFDIRITETGFIITTRGYGHAVGMSQYGANGMANNGSNYKKIINHYYTGVAIKNLY